MILFETEGESNAGIEVRLGYLLAETAWGSGLASELVCGFVDWCRRQEIASIVGGVGSENIASRRVLEKNGFTRDPTEPHDSFDEDLFRLELLH